MEGTKILDIIKHPGFLVSVKRQLLGIQLKRSATLSNAKALRLKRSSVDSLEEKGIITADKYPLLYLEILLKKSNLSSRERAMIKYVGDIALIETKNKYFQENGTNLQ